MRTIAISIAPISNNNRGMLRGALKVFQEQSEIQVFKHRAVPFTPIPTLRHWSGDGAVVLSETKREQAFLASLNIPVVVVSLHQEPHPALPVVHSDNASIGRIAARHLLEAGLRRFVFVGHSGWHHNQLRLEGFRQELQQGGYDVQVIDVRLISRRNQATSDIDSARLCADLNSITPPVGVFATHDEFAHEVLRAVQIRGLQVPTDCAIVGVNDYKLICETSRPALTSIRQDAFQIGFRAGQTLLGMLRGQVAPDAPILIPPSGIVRRQSSDYRAVDDELVKRAISEIDARFRFPVAAVDIANDFGIGRRALDNRFRASIGHSVAAEIRRARLRYAEHLLMTTNLSVTSIGSRCGFDNTSAFIRVFRETHEKTPKQFRTVGLADEDRD